MTLPPSGRNGEPTPSGFAPTEISEEAELPSAAAAAARPWATAGVEAAPATAPPFSIESTNPGASVPDVLTDLPGDLDGDGSDIATSPTLSHIGRYALKRKLADGGLGTVYEAWDPLLSRLIAIKTLQFEARGPERLPLDGLFLNEARMAAGLSHRYIVTIHDAGLSAHGVYIAMERLVGQDLRELLASGWQPTPAQAALLVRRVADALAYAHGRGVVHCDIKPANIFMTRRQRPKVLDFGIARVAGAALPGLDGLVAGSPHYLAPEQLHGGEVDARTDLYALGAVLYELLAGRKAFAGDSIEAITAAVNAGPPTPPHELRPEVPLELSRITMRALATLPQDRFAGAAELSAALKGWLEAQQANTLAPLPMPRMQPVAKPRPRRSWAVPALVALALLCAAAAVVLRANSPGPTAVSPPSETAAPPAVIAAAAAEAGAPAPAASAAIPVATTAPGSDPAPVVPATTPVTPAPTAAAARAPRASRSAEPVTTATPTPAAARSGDVQLAVSPWGQVEVNGQVMGTTPPLARLTLPEGTHQVTLRNGDAPAHSVSVLVSADKPALVRHRFGP